VPSTHLDAIAYPTYLPGNQMSSPNHKNALWRAGGLLKGATLGPMTTREKAQKLLDELPEDELEPIVEILASRRKKGSGGEAGRGRDFLISVARGTSGLDLHRLRTVRDRAWR